MQHWSDRVLVETPRLSVPKRIILFLVWAGRSAADLRSAMRIDDVPANVGCRMSWCVRPWPFVATVRLRGTQ